ncbi:MAG: hypothetical protein ACREJ2_10490 [Planctomycetota bacterium]
MTDTPPPATPLPAPNPSPAPIAPPAAAPSAPASVAQPLNPVFAYRRTWRKVADELQWGLVLGGLLGFAASLALSLAYTRWNAATNRLVAQILPNQPERLGIGWRSYAIAAVILLLGLGWGVVWRAALRHDFQRRFRL